MSATLLQSRHSLLPSSMTASAPLTVREAKPSDNDSLVALAAACFLACACDLRIDRAPDFFALNRLEGASWRLAVAEREGEVVGCICSSERECYVNGRVQRIGYVGDLKVHPDHRDSVIADALSRYAACRMSHLPEHTPVLITVLAVHA